jgi:hypothetical protein
LQKTFFVILSEAKDLGGTGFPACATKRQDSSVASLLRMTGKDTFAEAQK